MSLASLSQPWVGLAVLGLHALAALPAAHAQSDADDGVFALSLSGERTTANREFLGARECLFISGDPQDGGTPARPKAADWNADNRYGSDGSVWFALQTLPSPGFASPDSPRSINAICSFQMPAVTSGVGENALITTRSNLFTVMGSITCSITHLVTPPAYVSALRTAFAQNSSNGFFQAQGGEGYNFVLIRNPQSLQRNPVGHTLMCGVTGPRVNRPFIRFNVTTNAVFSLGLAVVHNGSSETAFDQIDILRLGATETSTVATTGFIPERNTGDDANLGDYGLAIYWFGFSNASSATYQLNVTATNTALTNGNFCLSAMLFEPGVGTAPAGTSTASSTSGSVSSTGTGSTGGTTAVGGTDSAGGSTTAGATTAADTTSGSTTAGSTTAGSTAGDVTAGSTSAGTATGGSGPSVLSWALTLKKPKPGRAVRFKTGRGLKVGGSFTVTPGTAFILADAAVSLAGSTATPSWVPLGKIGRVSKRSTVKFKGRNIGGTLQIVPGQQFDLRFRATDSSYDRAIFLPNPQTFSVK